MDGSSDKSRYEHAVQIAFTLHGGFLVVVILILGIGPLLKIGESVGAIRPAACRLPPGCCGCGGIHADAEDRRIIPKICETVGRFNLECIFHVGIVFRIFVRS